MVVLPDPRRRTDRLPRLRLPAPRLRLLVPHRGPRLLALGLVAVALGCRPSARETEHPVAHAALDTGGPGSANKGSDGHLPLETARGEAKRILAEVAQARDLDVTREVSVDVVDKPWIRDFARTSMYEEMTPAELKRTGRIQASLGVIPPGSDPEAVLLDLLEEGVMGLYDPKTKILHIGEFVPTAMLSMVVGHEIAHGLQDMHFGLERLQKPIEHESDAESARRFLIEGGAQAAYLAWVSGDAGLASIDDAILTAMADQTLELAAHASEYPILARDLQMPYTDGTATVIRLVLRDGWKAVDALYDDLPASTEQMLHLDKLLAREPPIGVHLDPAPLSAVLGLPSVWNDDLGEAALLSMLADVEPARRARREATGWGGDAYLVFDRADAPLDTPVVAAATVWDSPADAEEFEAGFRKYLQKVVDDGVLVARREDRVVFAVRLPAEADRAAVEAALWQAVTVDPPPAGAKKAKTKRAGRPGR